jgi:diphthine synthase
MCFVIFFYIYKKVCLFLLQLSSFNANMLYFIGLGLGDERDVTVRGLEIIKQCSRVYLEAYTSVLMGSADPTRLENFYGRKVIVADREMVESNSDSILEGATEVDVAFLVVGDPYG